MIQRLDYGFGRMGPNILALPSSASAVRPVEASTSLTIPGRVNKGFRTDGLEMARRPGMPGLYVLPDAQHNERRGAIRAVPLCNIIYKIGKNH